ncbi:uncharacterized protein LOC125039996 [Penaeus chinensis]|uniref:uncharacterized protein LOC125039996 n=1 Tax=Penaeus chinensis TaxID=139456 RepID=UPI001FB67139|nr:uncharacterized protein LOC125039996 [Penaeus chinensis]
MTSPSSVLLLLVGAAPRPTRVLEIAGACLVVVAAPKNGPGEPLVWNDARGKCGEARGDLAVIDNHEKLQLLSRFIDEKYPEETTGGWTYFVGAQKVNSKWVWTNGADVELQSNLWNPGQPAPQNEISSLVPSDQTHGRRYITSNTHPTFAPGYICERF